MKASLRKRIIQLEKKLKPKVETTVWLCDNGQAINPHTGEVLASEEFTIRYPDAQKITFKLWDE